MDSNKVLVELEWGQVDALVASELERYLRSTIDIIKQNEYFNEEDKEHDIKIVSALFTIIQDWMSVDKINSLKKELGYETRTD